MRHLAWLAALVLAGCATSHQAPVSERTPQPKKTPSAAKTTPPLPKPASAPPETDWRPDTYTVKKGDTLYAIGLEFGYDYKEIAQRNNIQPPYKIFVGQSLMLKEAKAAPNAAPAEATPPSSSAVIVAPLKTEQAPTPIPVGEPPLKTEPKAIKVPYSEAAMAAPLSKPAEAPKTVAPSAPTEAVKTVEAPKPSEPPKAEPAAEKPPSPPAAADSLDWGWPAQGKVIAGFNDANGSKGVDIAGTLGQPVVAAAAGKVVYSGSGLRGYGKLVIIKHNATYLSAYAHNSQILVKEGQEVTKGQKIAEMGSTDADRVKLHFEIRKQGKPTDPAKFLPEKP